MSKETIPFLDPHFLTSNMLIRGGKDLDYFVQEMLENEKRKVISVVKRYALTSNRRNSQTFFKASVFQ